MKFVFNIIFLVILGCVLLPVSIAAQPTITSFSPANAKPGDTVTLKGANFNTTPTNNIVFFGATQATVITATNETVTVTVPVGATYAYISLLNTGTGLAAYTLSKFIPTYNPSKTNITATDFSSKLDLKTTYIPRVPVLGDLDGDGKTDLIVINRSHKSVSVFHNTSSVGKLDSGSFAKKVDFATGTYPNSIAIGDLDGDGKLDLAITNRDSRTISVLRNTSTPGKIDSTSFATKVDLATGTFPNVYLSSIAIGDLDGDGKLDLVIAYTNSQIVSVMRNTATSGSINTASFATKVDFTVINEPNSIGIADIDGDGKPDLVVSTDGVRVSILRNISSSGTITAGSFAPAVYLLGGQWYEGSVGIGDLDGDGKPDIVVASFNSHSVSVFRNTSTVGSIDSSSFSTKVDIAKANNPMALAIGDFDGDSKLDVVFNNADTNKLNIGDLPIVKFSILRNTATIGSIDSTSFANKVDITTVRTPLSFAIGDLDGDGKPDLVVPSGNSFTPTLSILRNTDLPVFTFNGSGNWDNAANWSNSQVPPEILPANAQIIINPTGSSECILNVPVTVPSSSKIIVAPGKIFRIQGNLNLQ